MYCCFHSELLLLLLLMLLLFCVLRVLYCFVVLGGKGFRMIKKVVMYRSFVFDVLRNL